MTTQEEKKPKETFVIENNNAPSSTHIDNEPGQNQGKQSMLKDLDGDKLHVVVLFFLYILQGIPLGLKAAIPLLLSNRNVPYKEQAIYSISSYPFSMKILWAPLVDSVYIARFGRRKSWLVPVQYLIGITMLISSHYVNRLLGDTDDPSETLEPDVGALTAMFFILNFLAATQDVAVDGWALSMLKPKNVGYASTCNSVGQTTGWCLGYILYTSLEGYGVITLAQFLLFWGIVFLVTTTLIAVFKKEKSMAVIAPVADDDPVAEAGLGMIETYKILWKIIRHPLIPVTALFLLTFGFGFSAAEAMTDLKLIEMGVPKEKIAMLAIPMIPVKIGFTLFITRFTVGPRPMNVWLGSFPFRLLFCLIFTLFVYVTPMMMLEDGGFPLYYYVILIAVKALHRVALYAMFVAIMAFFARISDPAVGGTFMTFLNTLTNLGHIWPESFSLWFVDVITQKACIPKPDSVEGVAPTLFRNNTILSQATFQNNHCYGTIEAEECKDVGGECSTLTEGFYILSVACTIIGALWFIWGWRTMRRLQKVEVSKWRVVKSENKVATADNEDESKFKYFYCF